MQATVVRYENPLIIHGVVKKEGKITILAISPSTNKGSSVSMYRDEAVELYKTLYNLLPSVTWFALCKIIIEDSENTLASLADQA